MLQRIQTVYLLLVTGLLIAAMCLPVGQFVDGNGAPYVFNNLGVDLAFNKYQSTWALFGLLCFSAICSFGAIFFFKKRMIQIRMAVFSCILLLGYYVVFGFFLYLLIQDLEGIMSYQIGWALCLPAIALILNYLAFRAIYRDELMVKAADRLR